MNSLDAIIKSTNFAQKLNNQLSISNSMMQMIHSQELWQNKLSAMTMSDAIFKSIAQQQNLFSKNFVGLDTLSKTLAKQASLFKIPDPTLDAIRGISQMQESLFDGLKGIASIGEIHKPYVNQINSLQIVMSGISGHIAAIAAQNNNWQLLDDFEEINEQAFEFVNNFSTETAFTESESIKFQQLIDNVFELIQKNKHLGKKAYNFLNLIVLIYGLYQIYDSFNPKPESFTKEDIVKFEKKVLQAIELKFSDHKEYRTTNRISKVMFKPKTKTLIIATLPQKFNVIVLQINHKWAFISYINPKDNLMETGWVMKKYLDKNN
jgi:predicted RNA-binding protein with RPS1 domain